MNFYPRIPRPLAAALPAVALGAAALFSGGALAGSVLAPGAALLASAPDVGDPLPAPELEDFMQTRAKSFEDYQGRAVLIEFFEYW